MLEQVNPDPEGRSTERVPLRERILRGAGRAFGELGYASTRVEDILSAAGVSRPTFYKVFKSKDDVFEALSDAHHRDIFLRLLDAARRSTSPRERLERSIGAFFRWRAELGPVGRVLDAEARSPTTRLGDHREQILDVLVEGIQANALEAGLPAPDPHLARALVAATEHLADSMLEEPELCESAMRHRLAVARDLFHKAIGI